MHEISGGSAARTKQKGPDGRGGVTVPRWRRKTCRPSPGARWAQLISSSPSDPPTSSECLSGSASTRLLSECLSERSELMEARL